MNRSLLAVALLGLLAGSACAQSLSEARGADNTEAALEGPVNNAEPSSSPLSSGIQPRSRLGFQGAEYLGSGVTATLAADTDFRAADTPLYGTPASLAEHQAYAGLQGNFGAIRFGRQYSPLENATALINPLGIGLGGDDFHALAFDGSYTSHRLGNSVAYSTPAFLNGLRFEGISGYEISALDGSPLHQAGFGASYANGPVYVSLTQQRTKDALSLIDTKTSAFGGTYTMDNGVKLASMYQLSKNGTTLDTRDWLVGVSVPVGANTFMASYIRHINRLIGDSDANQFALGYSYSLTKRTNLFTYWAHLANDGIGFRPGQPGDMNNQFSAGIRHEF